MDEETYEVIQPSDEGAAGMDFDPTEPGVEPEGELVGVIDHDLPCRHCGYNLRGMTEDRACPECGTAVGRSLLGDQLRFSDPDWVRTLARGAGWILWSVLIGIALGISVAVISFVLELNNGSTSALKDVYVLLSFLPSLIYCVGVWFITAPEPSVNEESGVALRGLLRWTAVISIIINCISVCMKMTSPMMAVPIDLVGMVVGVVGYFALFVFARRLALRVPNYDLAKQTRTVMWGTVISLSGMVLFGILAVILGAAGVGAGAAVAAIPICGLGIAYLVFAIWALVLLISYRRASLAAALDAELTWASGTAGAPMY